MDTAINTVQDPDNRPDGTPRHPNVVYLLKQFTYSHMPTGPRRDQMEHAASCAYGAADAPAVVPGPDVSAGLRKLLEFNDCIMRTIVTFTP